MTEDGAFRYANPATCETLGYSLDELRTMTIHDVDPEFPAERWPEHMRELEQAGVLTFETRHRAKDGTVIPMEVTAMYLEYGGDVYDVAFARDIRERKRVEADAAREPRAPRLRPQVGRGRRLGLGHPGGSPHLGRDRRRSLRDDAGVLQGPWETFDASVHPDDLEALEAAIDDCLRDGRPVRSGVPRAARRTAASPTSPSAAGSPATRTARPCA